jgi:dienelactone hydrolase
MPPPTSSRTTSLLLVALLCAALAACTGKTPDQAAPSPEALQAGAACEDVARQGQQVHFGQEAGADLFGVLLRPPAGRGSGSTGLVLAEMSNTDACVWLPYGLEMANQGYRVLVFDFAGNGNSTAAGTSLTDQVISAVTFLRGAGVNSVALMGGSMGATAVLAATPLLDPQPSAVVSLSAPAVFDTTTSATNAAPKITAPVLYVAGALESQFPDTARALYEASTLSPGRKLLLPSAIEHGAFLVTPGTAAEQTRADVLAFLKINAHT